MKDDLSLLERFNLMDYSLLLCVDENPKWIKNMDGREREWIEQYFRSNQKTRHTFLSRGCRFIYHLSIIDYL